MAHSTFHSLACFHVPSFQASGYKWPVIMNGTVGTYEVAGWVLKLRGGYERAQDERNPQNVAQLCFSRLCLIWLCPGPKNLVYQRHNVSPLNLIKNLQTEIKQTSISLRFTVLSSSPCGFSEGLALFFLNEGSAV